MGSRNEIMEYRAKKIKKFMEIEEEEDDELFFIIVPALLEGLDEVEHTTSSCSWQNGADYGKKRKQSQVAGVLQEYVDFRKKQTRTFEDELDRVTKPKENYSIKNCLAVLESMEELSDVEKANAIRVLKCEQNREIFLNFKNPNVRLLWIQDEIAP